MRRRERYFLFTIDADWVPGSAPGLEALLQMCEAARVRATVFTTGRFALEYPGLIRDAHAAGHEIGVHGWEHPMPAYLVENYRLTSIPQRREWLVRATDAVGGITNQMPASFRAPFLWIDAGTFRLLEELGYAIDSSIPSRRFDAFFGVVNYRSFFWASLEPYHPDRTDPAGRGRSPILEVPPSAFLLPLNMSTLRFAGLAATRALVRLLASRSAILNFYCHPWEFVDPAEVRFAPGTPARHTQAIGPRFLPALGRFLDAALGMGYRPVTVREMASCGSWS